MRSLLLFLLPALLVSIGSSLATAAEKPLIYVPVQPYEWLFERIGGDAIEVHAIVGEGDDAHDYAPSPRELARISKANLLFSGELGFEGNFFVKVGDGVNAPLAISLLDGLELLEGSCEDCHDDHHGHEDEHKHEEEKHEHKDDKKTEHDHDDHHDHDHGELKDPHVWLSPKMLKQQAVTVAGTLKKHTPAEAHAKIDANLKSLVADLTAVDAELTKSLAPLKGQSFYVYHGAFAYFAAAYELEQKAIEVTGKSPTPKQIAALAKQAKAEGVKLIFVQPQFDQSSAISLAETIGGTVQTLDPLEKDVIANLRSIAEAIHGTK